MSADGIDFDIADLAAAMAGLTPAEIDRLPFGVVALDRFGTVQLYNRTERVQSGYRGAPPLGQNFFEISNLGGSGFLGRIEQARQHGKVDLEIGWFGDFADPGRALRIRVQSGGAGDLWLFIQRDPEAETGGMPKPRSRRKKSPGCGCPPAED